MCCLYLEDINLKLPACFKLLLALFCAAMLMIDLFIVMTFKVLMVTPSVPLFEHLRLLVLSAQLHVGLNSTWWGSISNSPLVSCCLLYFVYVHLLGTLHW